MKKILSAILVIVMIMSAFCINVSAEEAVELSPVEKSEIKLRNADADRDGTYSISDVQLLLKAAAGTGEDKAEYDINSDGYTSVEDALAVLREATGVKPLLTDAEALELANAKLNGVKVEKPGFDCVSTAQCTSMKITQKITAEGTMAGLITGLLKDMNYTDLEYDKYVDKMVAQLESSKDSIRKDKNLTEAQKQAELAEVDRQIAAMEKSGDTYKDVDRAEKTVVAGNINGHKNYFPVAGQVEVSSSLTLADIEKITYTVIDNEITFDIVMKDYSYTNSTYPKTSAGLADLPYGKVFNLPYLRGESGSTLIKADYKNGNVKVILDKDTAEITTAAYSYDYFSNIKAPVQSNSQDGLTLKVEMSTKMNATVNETFTF